MANAVAGRQQNGQVAHRSQGTKLRDMLESMKGEIAKALPSHIKPERMLRVAATAIQRTPKLLECSEISVVKAIVEASQLGLEPDGVLGQAYLVPYGKECQLIPGYRGLINLARRSGEIKDVMAEIVYEKDEFDYQKGTEPKLVHKPSRDADPGPMIGAYAIAFFRDGGNHYEFMFKGQIDAIRRRSKAANNGPWVTDYEEMAKKTVTKRLCKWLPMSVELAHAMSLEAAADRREYDFDVTSGKPVAPASVLDQLTADPDDAGASIPESLANDLDDLAAAKGFTGAKLKEALNSWNVSSIGDLTPEQAEQFQVFLNGSKG